MDQALYRSARVGVSAYRVPVAGHGKYRVRLRFAEIRATARRQRVFDVKIEGRSVARRLDLFRLVGRDRAYDIKTDVLVTDGELTVSFRRRVGRPIISAVEVDPLTSVTTTTTTAPRRTTTTTPASTTTTTTSPPTTTTRPRESDLPALTWAPPAGWESFTAATVPSGGGTLSLRSDTDYRLVAPGTITGPLHIRGGRNVVWIGGHIRIDDKPAIATATYRRGLVISDASDGSSVDGRVVHIEGLRIDGNDLSEGINTSSPRAVLQLENIHVRAAHIRGSDDRDAKGVYTAGNHADVLQPWGGFKEIRVDGLTGSSNYQGFYYSVDIGAGYGKSWFRRVNLAAVQTTGEETINGEVMDYAGHRMYRANVDRLGQQRIESGTFWVQHHQNSGWARGRFRRDSYRDANGVLQVEPVLGSATFTDTVWGGRYSGGQVGHTIAADALGTYATWPDSLVDANGEIAIRNWNGTASGRIYSGVPPHGDYVPAGSVGLSYVSPGYS
jgi:hypothetical protein